ncbi:hypothetical protein MLD38_000209 [Melastoma candidum]|uniref:Uncharacterized protein n=1 Tax=Melastoma candidum TaxID=119954 RepID=A0ACB9S9A1_9MYRT|nr:hypothetical protein MLD38_000209 [Melastoma candidum]
MGCVCTREAVRGPASPNAGAAVSASDSGKFVSGPFPSGIFRFDKDGSVDAKEFETGDYRGRESGKLRKDGGHERKDQGSLSRRRSGGSVSFRFVEAEETAAGWPSWLTSVAGEAIHGLIPLNSDAFEKLEKIGQGTYSSVFRARDISNGRMVALKKVRFDNYQPESIRFMAREIMILRRLDHPNIMKLEGIIISRLSSSIYLVFDYMDHDLSGLISSSDITFSVPQVKCYMKQLLAGLEHCHIHGVVHRDIKTSNILLNNEGVLKIADFGLANVINPNSRRQLTSRVVTLWYRPPELLMGSTSYGVSVDLWSVGCVFAELLMRKPLLKGRTEVEQLHKIFRLCGPPPDDYWKTCKIPQATMFKPQQSYESCLRERCRGVPPSALSLMETLLSIEPHKRGTASSALISEYFGMQPFACHPSHLPKYPPRKEIDVKPREDGRRKKTRARLFQEPDIPKKPIKPEKILSDTKASKAPPKEGVQNNIRFTHRCNGSLVNEKVGHGIHQERQQSSFETRSAISDLLNASEGRNFSGPILMAESSGFAWAKRRKDGYSVKKSHARSSSRSQISAVELAGAALTKANRKHGPEEGPKIEVDRADCFDVNELYQSPELITGRRDPTTDNLAYKNNLRDHIEFSGPMIMQSHKIDELLQGNESRIRLASSRSRSIRAHRE